MNRFDVIVADPPWQFDDRLTMKTIARGSEANYSVLDLQSIKDLPVNDVASDNALLALWVPSSMIIDGLNVMRAWGFKEKQIYTWVKTTKNGKLGFGMGRQFRGATEHALIGTKGKPKPVSKSERNVELFENLKHSQKPEGLQDKLEKMYPQANKLEMFARRDKPNWTCIGLECPSSLGVDIREWFLI